jgi:hypothetical protein
MAYSFLVSAERAEYDFEFEFRPWNFVELGALGASITTRKIEGRDERRRRREARYYC